MRRTLFAFLVWTLAIAAECRAQSRDSFTGMPIGKDIFPMMYIDEAVLSLATFPEIDFPQDVFDETRACLVQQGLSLRDVPAPRMLFVPAAHTIRVADLTLDSLIALKDSTAILGRFQNPTIAYTLERSGVILVTERAAHNRGVLRHEAIHWLLWYGVPEAQRGQLYGHPPQYFYPCDWNNPSAP